MPSLGEKLIPFYKLLKKQIDFEITEDHYKNLETLKADLIQATTLTLRLPKPGLQYTVRCQLPRYRICADGQKLRRKTRKTKK